MQRCADAGDAHAEALADAAFHKRIIDLSGNATLARVWRTLEPFSRTYITLGVPGADRRRIADEHVPVLEALRARDPELATDVLHRHFERCSGWPRQPLDRRGRQPAVPTAVPPIGVPAKAASA